MSDHPVLGDDEVGLDADSEELIWRNVHPTWIDKGKITSQVFRPTPKDSGQLSGAREEMVTAETHYHEFTTELGLDSSGVWAISVREASGAGVRCVYDAESISKPDPCPTGHTYIDYRGHSGNKIKRIGSALRDSAEERGRRHPTP